MDPELHIHRDSEDNLYDDLFEIGFSPAMAQSDKSQTPAKYPSGADWA